MDTYILYHYYIFVVTLWCYMLYYYYIIVFIVRKDLINEFDRINESSFFETVFLMDTVGPKICGPSPPGIKGPKPGPRSPTTQDVWWKSLKGPRIWLRRISRSTPHRTPEVKDKPSTKALQWRKAAHAVMWSLAPNKPILQTLLFNFPQPLPTTLTYELIGQVLTPTKEKLTRRWRTGSKY